MEFATHRRLSFEEKLASLEANFQLWEARSDVGQPFRKHQRQLKSIFMIVRKMLDDVRGLGKGDRLSGLRNAEKGLLAGHRIWEYFRAKLAQRSDPMLGSYLAFADELAWACYSPVQKLVFPDEEHAQLKEPPLVYLNGGMSPFALTRTDRFTAEEVAGEPLDKSWDAVTRRLPVPVIGVPWYQTERIFDALVIVHEVGHIVESDFGLDTQIVHLMKAATQDTPPAAWKAWESEVFADIFGCVCAGPAFVSNLLETIAVDADTVRDEIQVDGKWAKYPPLFVRGLLNLETIRALGFDNEANRMERLWRAVYPEHGMDEFDADAERVAHALVDGPYPAWNGSLRKVFDTKDVDDKARIQLDLLRQGGEPQSDAFLVLFAASRLAFEDNRAAFQPDERISGQWKENTWPGLIESRMKQSITPSTRATPERVFTSEQEAARSAFQEDLGVALLKELVPGIR